MSSFVIRLLRIRRCSQDGKRRPGGSAYGIDESRKRDVALCQPFCRMCRERDFHLVVYVRPFRMVIHFLRFYCHARHETERLVEIGELETSVNGAAIGAELPLLQLREKFG